jgi:putative transcriptional regulator
MGKAFDKIAGGLHDAIAMANAAKVVTPKQARARTGLTQEQFATRLRVPVATVRDWEQGRRSPDAAALTLLAMVAHDHRAAFALIDAASTPVQGN